MREFASILLLLSLLSTCAFLYVGNIPTVEALPELHQGDMILSGNNVTVIEGSFDINGSIIVTENATLILNNAVVNFVQTSGWQRNITLENPLNGYPRLQSINTTVTSGFTYSAYLLSGSSTAVADSQFVGSSGAYCWFVISGTAHFENLTAHGMSISDGDAFLSNSSITDLNVYSGSLHANSSNIHSSNTYGTGVTSMDKCTLSVVYVTEESQQYVSDSTTTDLVTYYKAAAWLVNSTYTGQTAYNESAVFEFWYLAVHVVDNISQDIPSANVTARYPNSTVAESKLTDINGMAKLTLMQRKINATGSFPIGDYTIQATHEIFANNTLVDMTENQEITITLPFIIPELTSSLVLQIFMVATILAVIAHKRRRVAPR